MREGRDSSGPVGAGTKDSQPRLVAVGYPACSNQRPHIPDKSGTGTANISIAALEKTLAYRVERQEAHTLPEGTRRTTDGIETLKVITSGGFAAVYRDVLPEFEQRTSIKVETGFGASEGAGTNTIRYELANGTKADVVILGREGLCKG